jgi:hypothetical protein
MSKIEGQSKLDRSTVLLFKLRQPPQLGSRRAGESPLPSLERLLIDPNFAVDLSHGPAHLRLA